MKTAASWSFVVAILVGTGLGTLAVYDVAHKYFAQGSFMGEFGGALILLGPLMCALLLLIDRVYYRTKQERRNNIERRLDQISR